MPKAQYQRQFEAQGRVKVYDTCSTVAIFNLVVFRDLDKRKDCFFLGWKTGRSGAWSKFYPEHVKLLEIGKKKRNVIFGGFFILGLLEFQPPAAWFSFINCRARDDDGVVDNYKDGELLSWNCQTFGQKLVNPISVMFMKRICPTAAIDLEPATDMEFFSLPGFSQICRFKCSKSSKSHFAMDLVANPEK